MNNKFKKRILLIILCAVFLILALALVMPGEFITNLIEGSKIVIGAMLYIAGVVCVVIFINTFISTDDE